MDEFRKGKYLISDCLISVSTEIDFYMNCDSRGLRVYFMGGVGFPNHKGAEMTKQKLLARSLVINGCDVCVINRRPSSVLQNENIVGHYYGIKYINASGASKRSKNFFVRNYIKFLGMVNELKILRKKRGDVIISNTRVFRTLLYYWMISRLFKFKFYITYVEYASKLMQRQKIGFRINDYFFEHYSFFLLDGVFPISEILKDVALRSNAKLPWMKIPVMVDMEEFDCVSNKKKEYLLYCGGAMYSYAIQLIVDAFDYVHNEDIELILVMYGSSSEFQEVNRILDSRKFKNPICILSDLEYNELVDYYQGATGLLIPLIDSVQDKARFPHKIAEYAASSRPIVTTNYGEIVQYFTDGEDAFIAEDDTPKAFGEKINFLISNMELANRIGINGRKVAYKYFDYKTIGAQLTDFLYKSINGGV